MSAHVLYLLTKVDSHFCYQMSLKVLHISVFTLLNNVCEG